MISLNNGNTYLTATEAVNHANFEMMALAQVMDDELREQVHSELAPCTEVEFLTRYLELADSDLVIG